jgi:PPOX class probable F420-dependent enzyme
VTRDEALARLASARVGRLATVRPDGSPHVMPFVFAVDGDRLYWAVDAKPKRTRELQRLENIRHDSRVEVLVDGYDEDWSHVWWVRAAGRGRILDGREPTVARAISLLASKYAQYRVAPPSGPVVAIEILAVTGWDPAPV